jgi:hypothetical protein
MFGNVGGSSFFHFHFIQIKHYQYTEVNSHIKGDITSMPGLFLLCAGYGLLLKQCTFSAGVMYALWVSLDRPEDPFWWVYIIYTV